MKYKYYLRGLGIGILVTTLILTLANRQVQSAKSPQEPVQETEESTTLAQAAASGENQSKTAEEQQENNPTVAQNAIPKTEEPVEKPAEEEKETEPAVTDIPAEPEIPEIIDLTGDDTEELSEAPEAEPAEEEAPEAQEEEAPVEEPVEPEESKVVAMVEEENDTSAEAGESTTVLTETVRITIPKGASSVKASKLLAEAGLVESTSDFDKYLCENRYDKYIRSGTKFIPKGATYKEIAVLITSGKD